MHHANADRFRKLHRRIDIQVRRRIHNTLQQLYFAKHSTETPVDLPTPGGITNRLPPRWIEFNPRPSHSRIFANGNRAGRCHWSAGFLGDLPFPPPFHSSAAPYSPYFTLIGSQDLDVKSPLIRAVAGNVTTKRPALLKGGRGTEICVIRRVQPPQQFNAIDKAVVYATRVDDLDTLRHGIYACSETIRNTPGFHQRIRESGREIPEKTRRPTASSGTIPTCENPVTRSGIEPGSPWWETSVLIAQPPWPQYNQGLSYDCRDIVAAKDGRGIPPGDVVPSNCKQLARDLDEKLILATLTSSGASTFPPAGARSSGLKSLARKRRTCRFRFKATCNPSIPSRQTYLHKADTQKSNNYKYVKCPAQGANTAYPRQKLLHDELSKSSNSPDTSDTAVIKIAKERGYPLQALHSESGSHIERHHWLAARQGVACTVRRLPCSPGERMPGDVAATSNHSRSQFPHARTRQQGGGGGRRQPPGREPRHYLATHIPRRRLPLMEKGGVCARRSHVISGGGKGCEPGQALRPARHLPQVYQHRGSKLPPHCRQLSVNSLGLAQEVLRATSRGEGQLESTQRLPKELNIPKTGMAPVPIALSKQVSVLRGGALEALRLEHHRESARERLFTAKRALLKALRKIYLYIQCVFFHLIEARRRCTQQAANSSAWKGRRETLATAATGDSARCKLTVSGSRQSWAAEYSAVPPGLLNPQSGSNATPTSLLYKRAWASKPKGAIARSQATAVWGLEAPCGTSLHLRREHTASSTDRVRPVQFDDTLRGAHAGTGRALDVERVADRPSGSLQLDGSGPLLPLHTL
ncbi:hypothetical protein PR048_017210 [Dryococelus australis]|uniref:Uncharacterized protein n=1 Tax=Dryococelus australis TaxID=614101 RepID=A0ABQ9H8V7_9NEOP|nr:hypothetical protein PR048_017210 [Dryococelus australis]